MAVWFLRHYSPWVERMVIWDEASDDGTRELLRSNPKVDLRDWPYNGLDDDKFLLLANSWYKEARGKADFVAIVDMDELLYHPNMLFALENSQGDIHKSTGYALINPAGWPVDDGHSQIYDLVRTGVRQNNYDKKLIFKPELDVQHTYGRHSYTGKQNWPKHNGRESALSSIKLLHLHHVGGVADTVARNQRNYDAAVGKKFAWNYLPENDNPAQVGTVAWVRDAIENGKLIDVMNTEPQRHQFGLDREPVQPVGLQIQFGCGPHHLPAPWKNHDLDADIRKRLPYPDGCAKFIYASHVIEHVTHREAWSFLAECHRLLMPGGVVRIAIPDIARLENRMNGEYAAAVKAGGHGNGSPASALRAMVFEHGHQAAWTAQLLEVFMRTVGFKPLQLAYGFSPHPELMGIDSHGKSVGESVAITETSIVEGTK